MDRQNAFGIWWSKLFEDGTEFVAEIYNEESTKVLSVSNSSMLTLCDGFCCVGTVTVSFKVIADLNACLELCVENIHLFDNRMSNEESQKCL